MQKLDVERRISENEPKEFWMDGVDQSSQPDEFAAMMHDIAVPPDFEQRPIRPLTQQLIECCQLDAWPSHATVVDFGIDSSSHLGAIQYALREELVTPQELDAAMGKGDKLTEIAQRGDNLYRDVTFKTSWDDMPTEEEWERMIDDESKERGDDRQTETKERDGVGRDRQPHLTEGKEAPPVRSAYEQKLHESAERGKVITQTKELDHDR